MATYPPAVERWRPLVSKYFKPEDVDKALYVIQHESGGNPSIKAAGTEPSYGLFQTNQFQGLGAGYSAEQLKDPDFNAQLAARAVYGGSGWSPWGEGVLYNGKPFGALGNRPYPSGGGRGTTAPAAPAQTPPGGGGMSEIDLSGLTGGGDDSSGTWRIIHNPRGEAFWFNSSTREIEPAPDFNKSAEAEATAKPQGAVSEAELREAGAKFSLGKAVLNGQEFKKNPDGTYTMGSAPSAANATIASGAGLARLYPGPAGLNNANTTTSTTQPTQSSQEAEPIFDFNPLNSRLNMGDVGQAAALPGIQRGETLGSVEPMYSGFGGPLPVNQGGVYEGGGMTPIPGSELAMARNPQFGGMIPGQNGAGPTSVGFGFNPAAILQGAGLAPTGLAGDADTAMNVMSQRQKAMDNPALQFIDLPAMQAADRRGDAPSGQYKSALSNVSKGVGRPLSALDLMAIPDYTNLREPPETPGVQYEQDELGQWGVPGFNDGGSIFTGPTTDPNPPKPTYPGFPQWPGVRAPFYHPQAPMPNFPPMQDLPGFWYEPQDYTQRNDAMPMADGGSVEVDPDVPLSMRGASKPRIHIGDSAPYRTDTVSREMHGDRFIRDAQGGPWQTETRFGVPQWEDFTNKMGGAATGGWNQVMQRTAFTKLLEDYFGRPVPLAHWGSSVAPPPMSMIQGGQRRTFSFANGGDMLTDEPIVGMGTYSGQPRFTLGEPNALTGEPTREVLSVKPLEPSVPMPMSPPMGGQMPMSPPAQPPQATPEILRLFLQNTRRPVRMGVT